MIEAVLGYTSMGCTNQGISHWGCVSILLPKPPKLPDPFDWQGNMCNVSTNKEIHHELSFNVLVPTHMLTRLRFAFAGNGRSLLLLLEETETYDSGLFGLYFYGLHKSHTEQS